jgi:hypothetical protein
VVGCLEGVLGTLRPPLVNRRARDTRALDKLPLTARLQHLLIVHFLL